MKYCRDTMSKYSKILFQVTPSKLSEEQIKQVEEYIDIHKNDYRKSVATRVKRQTTENER